MAKGLHLSVPGNEPSPGEVSLAVWAAGPEAASGPIPGVAQLRHKGLGCVSPDQL